MERSERLKKIAGLGEKIEASKGAVLLIPELTVSEAMRYHLDNRIKIASNVFRSSNML